MLRSGLASFALATVAVLSVGSPPGARAAIEFEAETGNHPRLFGDGMVLQRGPRTPVWGTAAAGASVHAEVVDPAASPGSEVLQSRDAVADAAGRWVVRFADLPVGGPYELRFYENAGPSPSVVLTDVLVGDVWLLSGQSNMVLRGPREGHAELFPDVRAITTTSWGQKPSGAAFYFGAELSAALGIPIGLVNRAQPDTALAHWLPPEVAADDDPEVQARFPGCDSDLMRRCFYYELHIRPLERPVATGEPAEGLALRGVVWWQGEKGIDKRDTDAYARLFPAMMRAWRANLGQPRLPFVFHQLPSGTGLRWNDLRVKALPRTGDLDHWQAKQRAMFFRMLAFPPASLMTSIDLAPGVHPREFDLYGMRLGDAALGTTYVAAGEVAPFAYSGPIFESADLEPVAGGAGEVRLRFRTGTADGLQPGPATDPPTTTLQGFAICCDAAGSFVFADARIENGNEVVVSHASVETPAEVHYAIGRNARWANLFNGAGLGAAPFSTALAPWPGQDIDGDGFWEPGPYVEP